MTHECGSSWSEPTQATSSTLTLCPGSSRSAEVGVRRDHGHPSTISTTPTTARTPASNTVTLKVPTPRPANAIFPAVVRAMAPPTTKEVRTTDIFGMTALYTYRDASTRIPQTHRCRLSRAGAAISGRLQDDVLPDVLPDRCVELDVNGVLKVCDEPHDSCRKPAVWRAQPGLRPICDARAIHVSRQLSARLSPPTTFPFRRRASHPWVSGQRRARPVRAGDVVRAANDMVISVGG